jgi:acylphosphatase
MQMSFAIKTLPWGAELWLHFAGTGAGAVMEQFRLQVIYSGRVQGVGFRYTAKMTARGFDVTGTVQNLSDGTVELIAEGGRQELEAFRDAIRLSGLGAAIRNEKAAWSAARGGFRGFEIIS